MAHKGNCVGRAMAILVMAWCCSSTMMAGDLATIYRSTAKNIITKALADSTIYSKLGEFCDAYPRRLSGSENLERGLDWLVARMKSERWNVRTQAVMVPNWKRGKESARMLTPIARNLPVCALGGSVACEVLKGEVVVVSSYADLRSKRASVKGKIVLYNVPFTTYGETVAYRVGGAVEASRYGAIASMVRSVGPFGIQTPHTGGMSYNDSIPKIPHAAITMEDALMMQRMQDRGQRIEVELTVGGHWQPDAPSRNIIIEIPGRELPNEVVCMGGHIDSWDLGTGAMDDAGGCFAAWHALETIRALGLTPKRTLRVVFWTNEENGLRGGKAYEEQTRNEKHVLGIESDEGTFAPLGFTTASEGDTLAAFQDAINLLEPLGVTYARKGHTGADTGPLEEKGVPVLSLNVDDTKYFWYHHTEGDTIDKLKPDEVNKCAAALAIMGFVFADR